MEKQAPTIPATVTLSDGVERTLRYSNKALRSIKAEYGVSPMRDGVIKLFEKIDEDSLGKLLALGLDHDLGGGQPGIASAEIDELLDAQNMPAVLGRVFLALGNSILKNALDLVLAEMTNPGTMGIMTVLMEKAVAEVQQKATAIQQTPVM